jgi:hypothetical protein
LADVEYELINGAGEAVLHRGAYIITDGGYHLWRCCQPPIKCAWSDAEARMWSVRSAF